MSRAQSTVLRPAISAGIKGKEFRRQAAVLTILAISVFTVWFVLTELELISTTIFPSPASIAQAFPEVASRGLGQAVTVTVYELLLATLVFVLVSVLFGVIFGSSDILYRATYGTIATLFAMPKITVLPIFVILFGIGHGQKILFGALYGIFPLIMTIMTGVRSVPKVNRELFDAIGAGRLMRVFRLIIPSMLPAFFGGVRIAFIYAGIGVLLAEMYVSSQGLGQEIVSSVNRETLDYFWIYVATATAIMLTGATLLQGIERRLSGWRLTS